MSGLPHRSRGWLLLLGGGAVALGLVAYGIWRRDAAVTDLHEVAQDAAIPRVQLVAPRPGPARQTETFPGNVQAWNQAPIYAQVSGYVTRWYKDYGARVAKGDLLAEIEAPELDAQYEMSRAQLESAVETYNLAQVTADRYGHLKGSAAVSQQQIDNFVSAAATAKAQMTAAQESVKRYYAMIGFKGVVAPFDGVVTSRRVNNGDYVTSSGSDASARGSAIPLFNVADVEKLRVFVAVPQHLGASLSSDMTATLTLPNAPGKAIGARFLTQAGAVNPATRTIVTELVVSDGSAALLPGSYVDVHLSLPGPPNLMIVPSQALLFRAEGMQVAKVDDGGHIRLQDVRVGDVLGLDTQVLSGLTLTDRIVGSPSLGLLDGQAVRVVQPAR